MSTSKLPANVFFQDLNQLRRLNPNFACISKDKAAAQYQRQVSLPVETQQ